MWLIGQRCKCGDTLSWLILIGRGLDLKKQKERKVSKVNEIFCIVELAIEKWISGDDGEEDPPVPIPNTEVKLFSADGTWWETARESRTLPEQKESSCKMQLLFLFLWNSKNFNSCCMQQFMDVRPIHDNKVVNSFLWIAYGINWNQRFHELSLWLVNCTKVHCWGNPLGFFFFYLI